MPEAACGRRLRFDLEMVANESIPGAIARGVREHVMVRTAPVLAAASVAMKHIGYSQLASSEELQRIAFVVRVPPEQFLQRAGERLEETPGGRSMETRFGRLVMPRAFLELERRRIGPLSLRNEGHHRLSWMNLLLPYCPESLEKLVDRCAECDSDLAWRYAVGIGRCDICHAEVPGSTEPPLQARLASDYRLFARLSSPDARGVSAASKDLPHSLHGIAPAHLVRLALLLGGVVRDEPRAFSRHIVTGLPADKLADLTSAGTELLRSWPHGLQDWVARRSDELRSSPVTLEKLRSRLRRVCDTQLEKAEVVDTVCKALPDLRRHAAHSFSHGRQYYLYKDVQRLLGLSSPRMEALKKWPGINFRRLNSSGKEQGQFDVDQIDSLIPAFRQTSAMSSCAWHFGLPLYAVEQLCGAGILEWENNEALLTLGPRDRVRNASRDRLLEVLLKNRRKERRIPADCVSLAVATKRIGGRLKPWAAMLDALLDGSVQFWIRQDHPTTTTIMLRGCDLARFEAIVDAELPEGLAPSPVMSQMDAAEALNVPIPLLARLTDPYALAFTRHGPGLAIARERVLEVAAEIAWGSEINQRLRVHPNQVSAILMKRGLRPIRSGWCRRHLIEEGILPAGPRA